MVCAPAEVHRRVLAGVFGADGAIVESVGSDDELVERVAAGDAPGLLVLAGDDDNHLHTLVCWARSTPALEDSVIVALSEGDPTRIAGLYRDGADVVLALPVDPDVLTAASEAAARRRR
jgi:DNA-binding NarL/FixJ family response regulator